jgi:hypothetical protein
MSTSKLRGDCRRCREKCDALKNMLADAGKRSPPSVCRVMRRAGGALMMRAEPRRFFFKFFVCFHVFHSVLTRLCRFSLINKKMNGKPTTTKTPRIGGLISKNVLRTEMQFRLQNWGGRTRQRRSMNSEGLSRNLPPDV